MENSIVKSKKEIDINKPKLTAKEFKRQWILVAISAVYVVYGIIFYYLPLNWTNLGETSLVMNISDLAFWRRIALTNDKLYLQT